MRPELFQPREFSFGAKTTDTDVKNLAGQIKLVGNWTPEVDPIGRTTGTAFFVGNLAVPIS